MSCDLVTDLAFSGRYNPQSWNQARVQAHICRDGKLKDDVSRVVL